MRIGFALFAWTAATLLSVAAGTAAVQQVRLQVTDRPSVVDLATLAAATTATTAPTSPSAVTDPPSVQADTDTGRPSLPEEPTTTIAAPSTESTDLVDTLVDQTQPPPPADTLVADQNPEETFTLEGGVVELEVDGDALILVSAIPADGFEVVIAERAADRVSIRFESPRHTSILLAHLEGSVIAAVLRELPGEEHNRGQARG